MTGRCVLLMVATFWALSFLGPIPGGGATTVDKMSALPANVGLTYIERFDGIVKLQTVSGIPRPLHVVIRDWYVFNNHRGAAHIPIHAFTIAHLLSGIITTSINGQVVKRSPNEFWDLAASTDMAVTVKSEAAIIETVASSSVP